MGVVIGGSQWCECLLGGGCGHGQGLSGSVCVCVSDPLPTIDVVGHLEGAKI